MLGTSPEPLFAAAATLLVLGDSLSGVLRDPPRSARDRSDQHRAARAGADPDPARTDDNRRAGRRSGALGAVAADRDWFFCFRGGLCSRARARRIEPYPGRARCIRGCDPLCRRQQSAGQRGRGRTRRLSRRFIICCRCFFRPCCWPGLRRAVFSVRRSANGSPRRDSPGAVFLAAATFAVGATLVMSGAMPAFTDRLQILALHVPLWAVETAHLLASIAGLVLLFAARGLLHRLDGAWWLALSMTLLSIPFCLVKGLAIVAPTAAAAAFGRANRRAAAVRPARLLLSQPLTRRLAGGNRLRRRARRSGSCSSPSGTSNIMQQLWWQFEFDATASRALRTVLGVALAQPDARRVAVAAPGCGPAEPAVRGRTGSRRSGSPPASRGRMPCWR